MSPETLKELLDSLTAAWENKGLEFKDASDNFSTSDIGKYFSAIANEANLRDRVSGWLVFGVSDKTHTIIGTSYREGSNRMMSLKQQIADGVDPRPLGFAYPGTTALARVTVKVSSGLLTTMRRVDLFQAP